MLQFIGTGSAFNTKLGNNSAFYKNKDILFLIDCGSNIFTRIQEANLLEGIKQVYVLITHTHPDHIGSLGDLIFYGYYAMGTLGEPSVTVISPRKLCITNILSHVGVKVNTYNLIEFNSKEISINNKDIRVRLVAHEVNHVAELPSFGYEIYYFNNKIYYSGDTNEINYKTLQMLIDGELDHFYQDTCLADYDGNVHLSLRRLHGETGLDIRDKITCMHLDNGFDANYAEALGFNVAKSILDVDKSGK